MNPIAGTGLMVRLTLRRERSIAPWWILLLTVMSLVMVSYIERSMGTPRLLAQYVATINANSFFRSLGGGSVVADPDYMAAWRSGGFLYVLNGLAALFAVIRHTRADEDTGRTELLRSGPMSRYANLTAALAVAAAVAVTGGGLVALALITIGLEPVGSLAYGAAITAAGLVFAAIGAVVGQLCSSARTARTLGLAILGTAYILRYAGDASGQYWMKYISPIGWSHLVEPYWHDRWWALSISITAAVAGTVAAYRLNGRRDLGAGMIPESRGPVTSRVRGPIGLAWRLHRALLIKWTVALAGFAAAAAGVSTMAHQLTQAPGSTADQLLEGFGGTPGAHAIDYGLWAIILIFAHLIALYPVLMVQRLRAEETSGLAEGVVATSNTRLRWAGAQLVIAAVGTAVILAVTGLVFGGGYALLVTGSATDLWRVLAGTLAMIPAAWLVGALCLLCYGTAPRVSVAAAWLVWIAVALLGRVAGPLYGAWGGTPFEPFGHIPNTVAGADFDPVPGLIMLGLTVALVAGGLWTLRRRDFG